VRDVEIGAYGGVDGKGNAVMVGTGQGLGKGFGSGDCDSGMGEDSKSIVRGSSGSAVAITITPYHGRGLGAVRGRRPGMNLVVDWGASREEPRP
jgi:hypothetical protein